MTLTPKGIEVYNEMVKLKTEIENQISNEIGEENVKILKNLLLKNWI
jgi:DNA-binding CsgD family transcriptional regulator